MEQAEQAIQRGIYISLKEYVKTMKTVAELEDMVGRKLERQINPSLNVQIPSLFFFGRNSSKKRIIFYKKYLYN